MYFAQYTNWVYKKPSQKFQVLVPWTSGTSSVSEAGNHGFDPRRNRFAACLVHFATLGLTDQLFGVLRRVSVIHEKKDTKKKANDALFLHDPYLRPLFDWQLYFQPFPVDQRDHHAFEKRRVQSSVALHHLRDSP